MGYFSNGTEGTGYQERFCSKCVHDDPDNGVYCPIWTHQLVNNGKEKNYPDSLIPLSKDGLTNEQCLMFHTKPATAQAKGE